jgi:hypothetical protein
MLKAMFILFTPAAINLAVLLRQHDTVPASRLALVCALSTIFMFTTSIHEIWYYWDDRNDSIDTLYTLHWASRVAGWVIIGALYVFIIRVMLGKVMSAAKWLGIPATLLMLLCFYMNGHSIIVSGYTGEYFNVLQ